MSAWLVSLDLNYLLIALCVSLGVNVWQFAIAHGLKAKLAHMFEHGHAPAGAVIVPTTNVVAADHVVAVQPVTKLARPSWMKP
jgi:hypothetical protein